jgi:ribosomal protein S18 acetylase RimI-like enzyme
VEEIITYLEMTTLSELRPSRPAAGVTLEHVDSTSPLIRPVQVRIGAPYAWPGASRSDEEWAQWLSHPLRRYWLIKYETKIAGIADFELQPGGEVEITTFGLLPDYIGRGLGGHALTLAIGQAWGVEPVGAETVRRIWLHTSTLDHPNALANYERRGFRPFRTRVNQREDHR